jgi:hypothetical protein
VARQAHTSWSLRGLPNVLAAMDELIEMIDEELR